MGRTTANDEKGLHNVDSDAMRRKKENEESDSIEESIIYWQKNRRDQ